MHRHYLPLLARAGLIFAALALLLLLLPLTTATAMPPRKSPFRTASRITATASLVTPRVSAARLRSLRTTPVAPMQCAPDAIRPQRPQQR